MRRFSYYPGPAKNVYPAKELDLASLARDIRADNALADLTRELRSLDEAGQKEFKRSRLPYVTFSGRFAKRSDNDLIEHSGLVCIDLDNIGSNGEAKAMQTRIREHLTPALMFVSPRGNGLKVIFTIDTNEGEHAEYFDSIMQFLTSTVKVPENVLDKGARAISQACFLCADPDAFYCDEPTLLTRDFIAKYQISDLQADEVRFDDEGQFNAAREWVEGTEAFTPGNRNHYMTKLVDCCNRYGINEDYTLRRCLEYATGDFTEAEIKATVKSRYNHRDHHGIASSLTVDNAPVGTKADIEFIRVGTTFYKVIRVSNRYGIEETRLRPWNKDTLLQDYKRKILRVIPKYDDFIMRPDNLNHRPIVDNCFNLYAPFPHKPAPGDLTWTDRLLQHIFGDQLALGVRYLQILYLHPDRSTVILVLVSKERGTGKTTFLNWISMLFGANTTLISSTDFMSGFNGHYGTKNIIMIEETLFDKNLTIEKLKALATAKTVTVNEKYTIPYSLPFHGKIIMTSNHESRFARIDQEEIRFFVRKLGTPAFTNHNIEQDLQREIPAFLDYLHTLPPVDWSVSRSGFTADELYNNSLSKVVEESRSGLYKDLKIELIDFFENCTLDEFYASPKDLKEKFFYSDHQVSLNYLRRVLREEFNIAPTEEAIRYVPFGDKIAATKTGRPYLFSRLDYTTTPGSDEAPY